VAGEEGADAHHAVAEMAEKQKMEEKIKMGSIEEEEGDVSNGLPEKKKHLNIA
jgi:hypothetical protein